MTTPIRHKAAVIAIMSGKGGVGKTMLAVSIARELSLAGGTLVVDLDFFNRGLSGLLVHGDDKKTIAPPAFLGQESDGAWEFMKVEDKLYTISFPDITDKLLEDVNNAHVQEISDDLKNWIDDLCNQMQLQVVVLDCHGGPDVLSFAAAKIADHVLLISEPDRITMHGTLHFLRRLSEVNVDTFNVHLVFNKVVGRFRSIFLQRTYNAYFRPRFADKPLLAVFPLEVYLTKHFEHHPFVTDDFPESTLSRKTQVMLADLLGNHREDLLSERTRELPQWVAKYWKHSFGRTPLFLQLDFVMIVCLALVVVGGAGHGYKKAGGTIPGALRDLDPESYVEPVGLSLMIWAAVTTVLYWSRSLDQGLIYGSRRRNWLAFIGYSGGFCCLWIASTMGAVYFFFGVVPPDEGYYLLRFAWFAVFWVVVVSWMGQLFRAYRNVVYTQYRLEPALKSVLGLVVIISTSAILIGSVGFGNSGGSEQEDGSAPSVSFGSEVSMPFRFLHLDSEPSHTRVLEAGYTIEAGTLQSNETIWYKVTVDSRGRYVITVDSFDGDPMIGLFGGASLSYLAEDDDGGYAQNSRIEYDFREGTYYLAVRDYRRKQSSYTINLRRATREF